MFLHLSVILLTRGSRQAPPPGRHPSTLARHPSPGQTTPARHPPGRHPLHSVCWDMVNKRAVRILLECNLVQKAFWSVIGAEQMCLGNVVGSKIFMKRFFLSSSTDFTLCQRNFTIGGIWSTFQLISPRLYFILHLSSHEVTSLACPSFSTRSYQC